MFISIKFTENSIDETNKTQQKVRGSKFTLKMSTIHPNTYIPFKRLHHCAIAAAMTVWSSSLHSRSRRSFNSFTSWIREW